MKKELAKGQDRKSMKSLQLHKETLHRLETPDLSRVAAGNDSRSFCLGTWTCCDYH